MTTRYKTPGEKAGVKRRAAAWRERQRALGLKPREVWVSDQENERIRQLIQRWRREATDLTDAEAEAADILKPKGQD